MTKREFYKAKFVVEVVSDKPIGSDIDLRELQYCIDHGELYCIGEGDVTGIFKQTKSESINAAECVQLLKAQGTTPNIFFLDDEGNDVLDETDEVEVINADGHTWDGEVVGFKKDTDGNTLVQVEDQDGVVWDVSKDQVTLIS